MLPSKPRSGYFEFSQKNQSFAVSKAIYASINRIRNDSISDTHSSVRPKSSKTTGFSEDWIVRALEKQQHMAQVGDERDEFKGMKENDKVIEATKVAKVKEPDVGLLDSLAAQTKQLEETNFFLEESRLEINALREKVKKLEDSAEQNLVRVIENEKSAFVNEIDLLKHELILATEAEENSKKAMDDLALALREVATEANQAKEKLISTEEELDKTKSELENLKSKLKNSEAEYNTHLDETRKQGEIYKNTAERLRLEAEETLLAWNEKETGLVNCIKRVEEEKASLIDENNKLLHALNMEENLTKKSKDENHKLRDILKQALNEANVAKEAATIARAENSQLKDVLAEKDDALDFITRENENFRINEASAVENIKELRQLLLEASAKDTKQDKKDKDKDNEKEKEKEQESEVKNHNSTDKEQKDCKKIGKTLSFKLKDLKVVNKHKEGDEENHKAHNKHNIEESKNEGDDEETPGTAEMWRGSIFDVAETPVCNDDHRRKKSSSTFTFIEDGATTTTTCYDATEGHLDDHATHFDDENDRSSKKKRALLRRFGDIIRRRSFHG